MLDKHELTRDNEYKAKLYNKEYADSNRKISNTVIEIGEMVLTKQKRHNKLMSNFNPHPCTVIETNKPDVTVRTYDGRVVRRNCSLFKKMTKMKQR